VPTAAAHHHLHPQRLDRSSTVGAEEHLHQAPSVSAAGMTWLTVVADKPFVASIDNVNKFILNKALNVFFLFSFFVWVKSFLKVFIFLFFLEDILHLGLVFNNTNVS
jgi:hypothetical protein